MGLVRGLFKWSLELTGLSIICFNYQHYDRQQKFIALYNAGVNSFRTVRHLFGVANQARNLLNIEPTSPQYQKKLQQFQQLSAKKIEELCEINKGVYARLGQIMSGMTGVLPQAYTTQFRKLNDLKADEIPYQNVKSALAGIFNKPMKEMFDAFQPKPYSVGLLTQQHKSILLDNYKQSVVKILLPSTKYQCEYDIWFINKCLDYLKHQAKKNRIESLAKVQEYENVVKEAEDITLSEINFEKQVEVADKLADLIEEQGSSFYIPYYYKKYANKNIIIKQFVEGVNISNAKGLEEIGLSVEKAFALIVNEIHRMMNKQGVMSGALNEKDIIIRKYIKPAKRKETAQPQVELNPAQKKRAQLLAKGKEMMHYPYQVVFTNLSNIQSVPDSTRQNIQNYWINMKKAAKKYFPSTTSFYERVPNMNNLINNPLGLMKEKYYLYEPVLNIYEQYVGKAVEKTPSKK